MLGLFKTRPLVDQISADWIFEAFTWALENFDSHEFYSRTRLIQPSNEFFPGKVDSVHAKAENIFNSSLKYAGLTHWPFELQAPEHFQDSPVALLDVDDFKRNSSESNTEVLEHSRPIYLTYNPQQTLKPEDLSSSFAHIMAQHLVFQSQILPPGGKDYFLEGTEVLAIFMGFGVMFANSAYTFRGGCGSCYNAQANRQAALSENEVLFSFALYCRLKEIPKAESTRYLKKHLVASFKRALKQIDDDPSEKLADLLAFQRNPLCQGSCRLIQSKNS